jgi:hypothetical protein
MRRAAVILCLSCLLALTASAVQAQSAVEVARRANSRLRWQCELEFAPSERWLLHCDDAQAEAEFDPALDDAPPRGWYITTFSAPVDPLKIVQLVRAVLCSGAPCEVLLNIRDLPGDASAR